MLAANCQNHFWLPKKKIGSQKWFWQSLLAELVENILRPKLLAERIGFGRILPKPVLAAKFFFWLWIHFWLVTYVCMTGTNFLLQQVVASHGESNK
jgi:hypothetical protein